jgi:hypothetical protein
MRRKELSDRSPLEYQPLGAKISSYQEPVDAFRAMIDMECQIWHRPVYVFVARRVPAVRDRLFNSILTGVQCPAGAEYPPV